MTSEFVLECVIRKIHESQGLFKVASTQSDSLGMTTTLGDNGEPGLVIPADNPEAVFDFLTIQSLKGRYGNNQGANQQDSTTSTRGFQSETDFETYVQQFPIDDTISQCFATSTTDSGDKKPTSLFLSGGKRPDPSSNKLRKKFGRKPADDIDHYDDGRDRDPKRPKPGGVLGKRHKWLSTKYESKNSNKRHTSSSDQSETDPVQDINVWNGKTESHLRNDSNSTSDSQITSFSEVFMRNEDQVVPYLPGSAVATSTLLRPGAGSQTRSRPNAQADVEYVNDKFSTLITGDSNHMIQQLEDLSPNEAISLRDQHGNTLLHRCVLAGSEDSVKYLLEKYPEMTADINTDNLTAVELAVKIGHYDCLKVMLDRNLRRKSQGPSLLNRLLTISSQYGQVSCLNLILQRLSSEPHSALTLPRDPRGNTAAHLAAKQGHLNCLQSLVAAGFDVSSENMLGQTPLHVAHQSRHQTCFEYLLLLHIAQDLVRKLQQAERKTRSSPVGSAPLTDSILDCFRRFNDLFVETQQMLTECRVSIMQTLERLQNDLELFIRHTATDSATKRQTAREKLKELAGEIERLEDTLEFSPLLETEGALSRLLSSVNADIAKAKADVSTTDVDITTGYDSDTVLRSIIKDIHREFLMENWSVDHIYSKYMDGYSKTPSHSSSPASNTSSPASNPSPSPTSNPRYSPSLDYDREERITPPSDNLSGMDSKSVIERGEELSGLKVNEYVNETVDNKHLNSEQFIHNSPGSQNSYDGDTEQRKAITRSGSVSSQNDKPTHDNTTHGDEKAIEEPKTADEGPQSTERPFTKLLSLDERIDLLIAGERAREKSSDTETLISAGTTVSASGDEPGSLYTTTFTSITSGSTSGLSEWYNKLGVASLESSPEELTGEVTSDSASYWWDQGEDRQAKWTARQQVAGLSANVKQQIHLQLENDEPSYEELRRQRLINHLRAVEQTRLASDNFCERITTSTGEVMGGFGGAGEEEEESGRIVVDVTGALRKRQDNKPVPKPRGLGRQPLFTLEDAIATNAQQPYNPRYHGNSSPTMKWEDMSFTDDDEEDSISWYEMEARNHHYYRSGTSTSGRSETPQSYV